MVKRRLKSIFNYVKKADIILWVLLAAISAYSLLLLYSVDRSTGSGYFRTQIFAIALGVAGAIFLSLLDYVELSNFWYLLAGFSVFLMIYTALFGDAVKGSLDHHWRQDVPIVGVGENCVHAHLCQASGFPSET